MRKIISEILDKGLGNSTWAEKFPEAYEDLLNYEKDMVSHANRINNRQRKKKLK